MVGAGIPLKDMHFRVQMCLAPEQEANMKRVMGDHSRQAGGEATGQEQELGYEQSIMSITEAYEWFQGLKLALDKEQAATQK
jgi:hypothetical protein